MAMTVTLPMTGWNIAGNQRRNNGSVTFDTSYPTGGYPYTNNQFGLTSIDNLDVYAQGGFIADVDYTNKKVIVRGHPTVTVVGGQGAVSAIQIAPDSAAGVLGKTAATTRTIPGATFGISQPQEVASGTDLSLIIARWEAVGV